MTSPIVSSLTEGPTENDNARISASTPAPLSSIIFITSVVINSAGITFTSITAQVVVPQNDPSSLAVASNHDSSPSNSGLKVGLGVGIPVGLIAVALFGFFLLRRRRKIGGESREAAENRQRNGTNAMEYMYKGHGDADPTLTGATSSPQLNQRASSKYVVSDIEDDRSRGVEACGHSDSRLHPESPELLNSPTRSELSGKPSVPHDNRSSQMSELAATLHQPSELPDRHYQ